FISEEYRTEQGYQTLKEKLNDIAQKAPGYRISYQICECILLINGCLKFKCMIMITYDIAQKAPGYRISYHNHAFEFETTINKQDALTYLLDPSEDNQILAEIDVYWVKKAGLNPTTFIEPYANRMPIIHLKDMTNDERQTFAEVGEGVIDFL